MKQILFSIFLFTYSISMSGQLEMAKHNLLYHKLAINPAYAGAEDVLAFSAAYQSNWSNFEGAPSTKIFNAHSPFPSKHVSIGLHTQFGQLGATQFWEINLSYNYRISLGKGIMSFGVNTVTESYRINYSGLAAANYADLELPQFNASYYLSNYGTGVYYRTASYFLGLSIPKLIDRSKAIEDNYIMDLMRDDYRTTYLMAGGVLPVHPKVKIGASFLTGFGRNGTFENTTHLYGIFFNTLWLGITHNTDGMVEGMVQIEVSPRIRIGFGQNFKTGSLRNYHDGKFNLMANYRFVPSHQHPTQKSFLF